jgi:hypothetical protein
LRCPIFRPKGYSTHWHPQPYIIPPYLGKTADRLLKEGKYGGIVGNDFAGVVEELRPNVPAGVRTVGERVAGIIIGCKFPVRACS